MIVLMIMIISFLEQELYQKEGLGVNEVHYVDNQDCIGMCCFNPFWGIMGRYSECFH